jgi:murein DD-endopeptidase MepM/ murein hydrolase activator NlpD
MGALTKGKNFKFIVLLVTFTFVIVAGISTFYTAKMIDIKKEQLRLITVNMLLAKKINKKKDEYELIQDKIEDIEELITQDGGNSDESIKKLLKNMNKTTKKLIVDSVPSGYPVESKRITSNFGYRMHPIHKVKKFHHGLDFGGELGSPITATADGIVEYAELNKGYGNLVVIHHNFGFKTAYGHMQENLKVKKGDFVKKGDVIGYLGNTGISTGPHLHYEVKYIKNVLDPKNFLDFNTKEFDKLLYAENHIAWDNLVKAIMSQYGRVGLARL